MSACHPQQLVPSKSSREKEESHVAGRGLFGTRRQGRRSGDDSDDDDKRDGDDGGVCSEDGLLGARGRSPRRAGPRRCSSGCRLVSSDEKRREDRRAGDCGRTEGARSKIEIKFHFSFFFLRAGANLRARRRGLHSRRLSSGRLLGCSSLVGAFTTLARSSRRSISLWP